MKKILFYSLSILALSVTACKKDTDAFGVHTMNSNVTVKQSGTVTLKTYSGKDAEASSILVNGKKLQILLDGNSDISEHLEINIEQPKQGYIGTYTLRSKDNAGADAIVSYFRTKQPVSNSFTSSNTTIEGTLEITDYSSSSKQPVISGKYRIVFKDVMNPDKAILATTEADKSDVTVSGTFKDAWVVLK